MMAESDFEKQRKAVLAALEAELGEVPVAAPAPAPAAKSDFDKQREAAMAALLAEMGEEPLATPAPTVAATPEPVASAAPADEKNRLVLVAETDPIIRTLIAANLQASGYEVEFFDNATQIKDRMATLAASKKFPASWIAHKQKIPESGENLEARQQAAEKNNNTINDLVHDYFGIPVMVLTNGEASEPVRYAYDNYVAFVPGNDHEKINEALQVIIADKQKPPEPHPPLAQKDIPTIVYADDDPGLRDVVSSMMAMDGYHVITTKDGKENGPPLQNAADALQVVNQLVEAGTPPVLVATDLNMLLAHPAADEKITDPAALREAQAARGMQEGFNLIQALGVDHPEIPIVVSSGNRTHLAEAQRRRPGAGAIHKPYGVEDFRKLVESKIAESKIGEGKAANITQPRVVTAADAETPLHSPGLSDIDPHPKEIGKA